MKKTKKSAPAAVPIDSSVLATAMPLDDRVIVRLDQAADRTEGGIIIARVAEEEKPQVGTVIAVGPGKRVVIPIPIDPLFLPGARKAKGGPPPVDPRIITIPPMVKVGDRVAFSKYAGTTVENGILRDKLHIIIREDDVICRLPD